MPLNDLPFTVQLLIGLIVPPALAVTCWVIGQRLAGRRRASFQMWREPGFWTLVLAAYILFFLALAGGRFLDRVDRADPSSQLVQ